MKQKGFTLVELLVVISIIGLLASVALVALSNARTKARDTKRMADLKQLSTALENYYIDNSYFPGVSAGNCSSVNHNANENWGIDTGSAWSINPPLVGKYISKVPSDPSFGTSGRGGNYMYYIINASNNGAVLCSVMETNSGNGVAIPYDCGQTGNYNYCLTVQ